MLSICERYFSGRDLIICLMRASEICITSGMILNSKDNKNMIVFSGLSYCDFDRISIGFKKN